METADTESRGVGFVFLLETFVDSSSERDVRPNFDRLQTLDAEFLHSPERAETPGRV